MSKKPISQRMDDVKARIEELKNQKKQLEKEQGAQERKARTHRLCKRGGLVEKLLPDIITLTDEQFDLFVDETLLTDHTRRKLAEIVAGIIKPPTTAEPSKPTPQDGEKPTPKATETQGHNNAPPPPRPANTAHNGGTGGRASGSGYEQQDG